MTDNAKPIKKAVAFYALNNKDEFLAVKRSDDDDSLPGVWGLAAASLREGESAEDAVKRGAKDKLGITVEIEKYEDDDKQERDGHALHLREYRVKIVSGEPTPQKADLTVSHYSAVQWSADPELLREAAEKGSSCSRIFLRNRGLWTNGESSYV